MKFNKPFFVNAALTAILLTLTTLSVNAKDYGDKNHVEANYVGVRGVLAAKPSEEDHGAKSSEEGFLAKHTTELEFTFAILVVVVGLIASERFQRTQAQQQLTQDEGYEISRVISNK